MITYFIHSSFTFHDPRRVNNLVFLFVYTLIIGLSHSYLTLNIYQVVIVCAGTLQTRGKSELMDGWKRYGYFGAFHCWLQYITKQRNHQWICLRKYLVCMHDCMYVCIYMFHFVCFFNQYRSNRRQEDGEQGDVHNIGREEMTHVMNKSLAIQLIIIKKITIISFLCQL